MTIPTYGEVLKNMLDSAWENASEEDLEKLYSVRSYRQLVDYFAEKAKNIPEIEKVYIDEADLSMVVRTVWGGESRVSLPKLRLMWLFGYGMYVHKKAGGK